MTQDEKTLFEVTISKVKNSASSIFSKDDVLGLLTALESCITELPEVATTGYTKVQIIDAVKDLLNDYSFEEFVSCDPELNGSYGDSYSLEMNTSFEEREFTRAFISELEDYFTPNEEQL
jgi:hypothetical protein